MVSKYNFSSALGNDNIIWGVTDFVNSNTNYLWAYFSLLFVFLLIFLNSFRKTQDVPKSLINSGFIVWLLSIVLYYTGSYAGVTVLPSLAVLTITVLFSMGLATVYFLRSSRNQ